MATLEAGGEFTAGFRVGEGNGGLSRSKGVKGADFPLSGSYL
jgi:hypothetical protein